MSGNRCWYCVKTKVRSERFAETQLAKVLGVECFLPMAALERKMRSGKQLVFEPMFPGYMFVKVELASELRKVKYAQGIVGFVQLGDRVPEISEGEIENLRALCDSLKRADVSVAALQAGDEVELVGNLFHGTQGRVVELLPAKNRVKVLIEFLNQAVEVAVSPENVFKGKSVG